MEPLQKGARPKYTNYERIACCFPIQTQLINYVCSDVDKKLFSPNIHRALGLIRRVEFCSPCSFSKSSKTTDRDGTRTAPRIAKNRILVSSHPRKAVNRREPPRTGLIMAPMY